ncbi:tigger transposable element-derived protein 1-like [Homarus americanus]|uniref:tigger transposable element-derived protein 1-like n=1 Tax=Homarus americanus TaxID=6706 RepID=UPI001C468359|nr:tigger transposable element-derived protein 1-like [Homarus americanus]
MEELEKGKRQVDLARQYGVNESTIRTIKKDAGKIYEHMNITTSVGASLVKYCHNKVLLKTESLLVSYIIRQSRRNMAVDIRALQDYAREFYAALAKKMGVAEPKPISASAGWLQGFKRRSKITNIEIVGEGASADRAAARNFPPFLRKIMEEGQYTDDQVFNMDESGLYWKKLPSKTFLVMSASNESEEHEKDLADHEMRVKQFWKLFNVKKAVDFLLEGIPGGRQRQAVAGEAQSVAVALENATGAAQIMRQATIDELSDNIKVLFLPPNTTSLLQPMDQGVIAAFKAYYLRHTFKKLIAATEEGDDKASVPQQLLRKEISADVEELLESHCEDLSTEDLQQLVAAGEIEDAEDEEVQDAKPRELPTSLLTSILREVDKQLQLLE